MIFIEKEINSDLYDPSVKPDVLTNRYSKSGLCNALVRLTDLIAEKGTVHIFADKEYKISSSGIGESVLYRTAADINNILFYKKDFQEKLKLLGIVMPNENDKYKYAEYLQLCYFFYIMSYFVFPDVRFFDLFKEKNWSADNISDAGTGNETYQKFIISSLFNDEYHINIVDRYNKVSASFQDEHFNWFELSVYEYEKLNGLKKEGQMSYIPEDHIELFNNKIALKIKAVCGKADSLIMTNEEPLSPKEHLFSYIMRYEDLVRIKDYFANLKTVDFEVARKIAQRVLVPGSYKDMMIKRNDIASLTSDDVFLMNLISKDHLTNTDRSSIEACDFVKSIEYIWEQEEYQFKESEGDISSFTFLKQDENGEFFMSYDDALIIAVTRMYLPYNAKFFTKRTVLLNRSDSQKSIAHSIKESYKAIDDEGFKPGNSALRNSVFRIMCRAVKSIIEYGEKEFYCFELPLNLSLRTMEEYPTSYDNIINRIKWFKCAADIMYEEETSIWKFLNE